MLFQSRTIIAETFIRVILNLDCVRAPCAINWKLCQHDFFNLNHFGHMAIVSIVIVCSCKVFELHVERLKPWYTRMNVVRGITNILFKFRVQPTVEWNGFWTGNLISCQKINFFFYIQKVLGILKEKRCQKQTF